MYSEDFLIQITDHLSLLLQCWTTTLLTFFIYSAMHGCEYTHAMSHMWSSKDSLLDLVLSSTLQVCWALNVDPQTRLQVTTS